MKALGGFVLAFWLIGLAIVVRAVRRWPPAGRVITITVPLTEPADAVQYEPRTRELMGPCTYRTGHGVCGMPESWEHHGPRKPMDFGGPHRYRHDPTGQDVAP